MNYTLDFSPVIEGLPSLLWGCIGTLGLAISGMALALVIGVIGVVLRETRTGGSSHSRHRFCGDHPEYAFSGSDYLISLHCRSPVSS